MANAKATALLLIDRFNAESLAAQAIGDRDLALGRANLQELATHARYPFVTTNLIDTVTGKPLFEPYVLTDVGHGVKVAFLGLIDPRNVPPSVLEAERLRVDPPEVAAAAAVAAVAAAAGRGATLFVVLSQLSAREEERVGAAVPQIQLFVGGDAMGMMSEIGSAGGSALSLPGSQKGKHLGIATLTLDDPLGTGRPFFDPNRRADLERKKREADQRIQTYDRLLVEVRARAADQGQPIPPGSPAGPNGPRRPAPVPSPTLAIEAYERQLVAARAESQLAATALAELPPEDAKPTPKNGITFELVPLSREVADDPTIQKLVEEHRKTWPDPTPGH